MTPERRKDDPQVMEEMRSWLREASQAVGVPNQLMEEVEVPLLQLISQIAHGPSRPGAPLSAYLVGYAAGTGADPLDKIEILRQLADSYEA